MTIRSTLEKNKNRISYIFHLRGFSYGKLYKPQLRNPILIALPANNNNNRHEVLYKYAFEIYKLNTVKSRDKYLKSDLVNIKILRNFANVTMWLYELIQSQKKFGDEELEITSLYNKEIISEYRRLINKRNQMSLDLESFNL